MESLIEILSTESGLTDKLGKQILGTPTGEPRLLNIPRNGNDFDRDRMELLASTSSDSILIEEIKGCKPDKANAYVLGKRYPIVHDIAPEHCDDYFAYPVQFYRI